METINDRFKMVRKDSGLSQDAFSKRLKITSTSISKIESGINNPSDRTIALVCSEFGISEEWLRTGNGPKTLATSGTLLGQLQQKYDMSDLELRIIKSYLELPAESRKKFEEFVVKLTEEQKEQAANPDSELQPVSPDENDEEVRYEDYIKNILSSAENTDSSASNGSEDEDIGEDKIS